MCPGPPVTRVKNQLPTGFILQFDGAGGVLRCPSPSHRPLASRLRIMMPTPPIPRAATFSKILLQNGFITGVPPEQLCRIVLPRRRPGPPCMASSHLQDGTQTLTKRLLLPLRDVSKHLRHVQNTYPKHLHFARNTYILGCDSNAAAATTAPIGAP